MSRKIISIAGIVFSLIFIAIFLIIWNTSRSVVKSEVNEVNSMYATEVAMDLSIFNNKVITGQTILNFVDNQQTAAGVAMKLKFYKNNGGTVTELTDADMQSADFLDKEYLIEVHRNVNGGIDGFYIAAEAKYESDMWKWTT